MNSTDIWEYGPLLFHYYHAESLTRCCPSSLSFVNGQNSYDNNEQNTVSYYYSNNPQMNMSVFNIGAYESN